MSAVKFQLIIVCVQPAEICEMICNSGDGCLITEMLQKAAAYVFFLDGQISIGF